MDLIENSSRKGDFACDMTLEMRVMGDSDATLAPYRGNTMGTVSIEVTNERWWLNGDF